jgi:hypothetical protein
MKRPVIDARPPMGPRIATPVAAIERAAALGHRRLYPIGDRARRSRSRDREEISVNQKQKSVTHVLNHRCYLCPDCALGRSALDVGCSMFSVQKHPRSRHWRSMG